MSIKVIIRNAFLSFLLMLVIGTGMVLPQEYEEKARRYTRALEFDYLDWTVDTLWLKTTQGKNQIKEISEQRERVFAYLHLVAEVEQLEYQISNLYSNPAIMNPANLSKELEEKHQEKRQLLLSMALSVESILQEQVRTILVDEGIKVGTGIFPPVRFRTSDMPLSLFISPRDTIRLVADISIQPGLSEAQKVDLEDVVETDMGVSALVEEVGGRGTYPAMVMQTTDLNWLVETIAHEWVHNYLSFSPLGINYDTSSELRTMNETTANLAGREIGEQVIETYYPELVRPKLAPPTQAPSPTASLPPVFNYQEEMRITREQVDELLARGEIEQAEAYMESRRRVFWDNGYQIRRINQAYFAFHGAYNDLPGGGEAGSDPVGPAVLELREQCGSLGNFLGVISRMDAYEDLQAALLDSPD